MRIFIFIALFIFTSPQAFANQELIRAAVAGDATRIDSLLQPGSGIDVNFRWPWFQNQTALHCAAENGNLRTVNSLLSHGADSTLLTFSARSALHLAARNGHSAVVESLILHGAPIDLRDNNNFTALHYAAENGDLRTVNSLLSHGTSINLVSYLRTSALHLAAYRGHTAVVDSLISYGADVHLTDPSGMTALQSAVSQNFDEIVRTIQSVLEKRALQSGDSALTIAIKEGNLSQVKDFLRSGVQVTPADLQLAQDCKYIRIIHYFTRMRELRSYQYIAYATRNSPFFLARDNLLMIREYLFGSKPSVTAEGHLKGFRELPFADFDGDMIL